jgi:hypothetical protein
MLILQKETYDILKIPNNIIIYPFFLCSNFHYCKNLITHGKVLKINLSYMNFDDHNKPLPP